MPPRAKRPCRHRGCRNLVSDSSGFCSQHRSDGWSSYQAGKTRQQRGYGRPWEIRRERVLNRDNHICQDCKGRGIGTKAVTVDHIIPKAHGGTDDDSNLQSLCWPCHRRKTATERTR